MPSFLTEPYWRVPLYLWLGLGGWAVGTLVLFPLIHFGFRWLDRIAMQKNRAVATINER
jgi:hypothetical protein